MRKISSISNYSNSFFLKWGSLVISSLFFVIIWSSVPDSFFWNALLYPILYFTPGAVLFISAKTPQGNARFILSAFGVAAMSVMIATFLLFLIRDEIILRVMSGVSPGFVLSIFLFIFVATLIAFGWKFDPNSNLSKENDKRYLNLAISSTTIALLGISYFNTAYYFH